MSETRIHKGTDLRGGDVIIIAKYLRSKSGDYYWLRQLACVTSTEECSRRLVPFIILKPNVNPDWDIGKVDVNRDHIYRIDPDKWPPGSLAMRIKYVTLGLIKIDGSE